LFIVGGKSRFNFAALDKVADIIMFAHNYRAEVRGHAADTGDLRFGLKLSFKRAQAVVKYLLEKGCPPYKVKAKPLGSLEAMKAGTDSRSAKSRKVEIRFYR